MPARPCLTDHRSRRSRQSGQGRRAPSTTTVAVPGHVLRGEQQDRRGPGDRLRQGLDGPRDRGLRHAQDLSDHRLHDVLTQVHQSRPQRPGQAQDRRIPLDPLLAQPGEQLVELIIGQSRGALHHDGPLLPGSWGYIFHAHDAPRGWAIIISPPEMTQDTPRITFHGVDGFSHSAVRRTHRAAADLQGDTRIRLPSSGADDWSAFGERRGRGVRGPLR